MAVKIRLKRMGKIRTAIYRVVVMDSRTKRDGRAIEEIGKYDPNQEPSLIEIDMERAGYWRAQGAQPTEAVAALLKIMDEGTLKVAEPRKNKKDLYEAAVAAAGGSTADESGATTARKRAAKKADAPAKADDAPAKADDAPAKAETSGAEETEPVAADTDGSGAAAESKDADADRSADAEAAAAAPAEAPAADAPAAELPAGAVAPLEDGSAPEGYTVKGNADSGKYHEADGQWYGQTVAEFWFKSAEDAEAAGFTRAGA